MKTWPGITNQPKKKNLKEGSGSIVIMDFEAGSSGDPSVGMSGWGEGIQITLKFSRTQKTDWSPDMKDLLESELEKAINNFYAEGDAGAYLERATYK